MANDQFNIPVRTGEQPLNEALRVAESIQDTSEKKEGMFDRLKAAEGRIHSYRHTALDIEDDRKSSIIDIIRRKNRSRVTLESLLESESFIGGYPFGRHNRMWLSHKGSSALANGNELGDWYHVQETYDQYGRKVSEATLHFETHPTHINKLYNGRPVPLTLAELEIFMQAVELYERNIREQLYPFDQQIFTLMDEIEAEKPLTTENAPSYAEKEMVARMVANHQAQQIQSGPIPDTVEEVFGEETVSQIVDETRTKL